MSKPEKISLKRAEISIQKFNTVAIPNYLGLLKNHKSNIEKSLALGDYEKIKREEINATNVIKQLKSLLLEMESVRNKIQDEDISKFDLQTKKSRQNAIAGIQEYLDMQLKTPDKTSSQNSFEDDELENIVPYIETDYQITEHQLKSQEACLIEFENLHKEVEELYGLFKRFDETIHIQKEDVQMVAENVDVVEVNTAEGESHLRQALRYKKTMYPLCGALLGTFIGGPVGLLVGIKAGGLAAFGCGILGFTGGSVLKKQEQHQTSTPEEKEE